MNKKTKQCTTCNTSKPISEFSKLKAGKYGVGSWCKACMKAYRKQYYSQNRESILEKQKAYDDENREAIAEYRKEHKEEISEYNRKWEKENKDKRKALSRKRRARMSEVKESYTPEMERFTSVFFGNKCYNCCSTENLTHDHHLPLSRGHALAPGNAVLLCKSCNSSKHNKLPKNFYSKEQLKEITLLLENQLQLWTLGARASQTKRPTR